MPVETKIYNGNLTTIPHPLERKKNGRLMTGMLAEKGNGIYGVTFRKPMGFDDVQIIAKNR